PVKSSFGYHLIEVLDKQPAGSQPFEQVKEMIRARLTAERARDLAAAKAKDLAARLTSSKPRSADDLKALAQQNPGVTFAETGKTLDQVAAELGVQAKDSAEFDGNGSIPGIGYNPELAKAVMALPTGQVGGPVADAQGGVLFQVTDHKGWDPKQYATNREQ